MTNKQLITVQKFCANFSLFAGTVTLFPIIQWLLFSGSSRYYSGYVYGIHWLLLPLLIASYLFRFQSRKIRFLILPLTCILSGFAYLLPVYNFPLIVLLIFSLYFLIETFHTKNKAFLGITSVLGMLLLINLGFTLKEKIAPVAFQYDYSDQFLGPDDDFGFHPLPSKSIISSKSFRGEMIYESIEYVMDEHGHRICPDEPVNAPFHALICGGSFAFGEGIPANDIIACQIQDRSNGLLETYNLAVPGSGTGQAYITLAKKEYLTHVNQNAGVCIYFFIPDHTRRNTGHAIRSIVEDYQLPTYTLDASGRLSGPLRIQQDPFLSDFYKYPIHWYRISPVYREYLYRYYEEPFTAEFNAEVTAQLISYAKYAYQTRFTGEFFVVIWPTEEKPYLQETTRLLIERLDENSIKYMRPTPCPDKLKSTLHAQDPHPSGYGNRWVLDQIWSEIMAYVTLLEKYHYPES